MTRKRTADPLPVPVNVSYRGYRSLGRWVVEKGNAPFRYHKYESSEISHDGPWRWGPREQMVRLLSWALLMDVLEDEDQVADLVDEFNRQFTTKFHPTGWMMSAENIRAAAERIALELKPDMRRKPR